MASAARLLTWAREADLKAAYSVWPPELPNPDLPDEHGLTEHANHWFLMSSGRILLHEFAHGLLNHNTAMNASPADVQKEEYDADRWADRWVLDRWRDYKEDERVFTGRCIGIILSFAPALHFDLLRETRSASHPLTLDRIRRFVTDYFPTSSPQTPSRQDIPLAFLLSMLAINVFDKGIPFDWTPIPPTYLDYITRFFPYFGGNAPLAE